MPNFGKFMMTSVPNVTYRKPGMRDWALLGIGVTFVLTGLLVLPSNPNVGIVTIAFFGPCAMVFATSIVRKFRFRRLRALRVEIIGGVPIRPSRATVFVFGASLAMMGIVLVAFGRSYGIVFWALAWLIAIAGFATLLGLAAGWLPVGYLQFDPPGITIGRRGWAYTVPWDCISGISAGEYHDNAALFIWLDHPDAISAHPPERKGQVLKHLARNARWIGAPIMLMTSQYGMDLPLLVNAMERYITSPSARTELSRRLLPQGDSA
jgi:uncharacterized membrane protein